MPRQYPTRPESVSQVRTQVRELLRSEGVDVDSGAGGADSVVLVASELASNAVCHAADSGVYSVCCELRGSLCVIRVSDDGVLVPPERATLGDAHALSGRGLFLVEALARNWGCTPRGDGAGKVIWAELLIAPPSPTTP
ncbi:ATP-binding protein [Streptomyces sp. NPDC004610]|uniref:ATP-binding protein n=1 Tax=unclassified Streptomyces TaxID=2593676 RepID=UPI00339DBD6A